MLAAVLPIAQAHGATVEVVDLDAPGNASLEAVWGERVPALFVGAPGSKALLCYHHLDVDRVAAGAERTDRESRCGRKSAIIQGLCRRQRGTAAVPLCFGAPARW